MGQRLLLDKLSFAGNALHRLAADKAGRAEVAVSEGPQA